MNKNMSSSRPASSWSLLKRLASGHLRPHAREFALAFVLMGIGAAATGALAKLIEPVVNKLGETESVSTALGLGLAVLAVFAVRGTATWGHTVTMNRIGQRIVTDVQKLMHRRLLDADLAFFHANASGTLVAKLTSDVNAMRQAVGECLTSALKGGLTLIFLITVMFIQDWKLSLAAFFVFPASAIFVAMIGKHLRRYATRTQEATGQFMTLLNESFQGIRHVKAYGAEDHEHNRIHNVTEKIYRLAVKSYHAGALMNPLAEILSGIAISAVVIYGHYQIIHGEASTGSLFSFVTAFILAYDPMKRTAKVNGQLQAGLAAAERVFDVLDVRPSLADMPHAIALPENTDMTLRFENVTFRYDNTTKNALDGLSITVPSGKTIALVGKSGAGKSTVINLIPRFYDVTSGSITLGGYDLREVTMASLRRNMALVSQDIALFDDTVHANISYGSPHASEDDVKQAARDAFAHEFIEALPQSYLTTIGENGVRLSGGQKQRIAIARAMLRNAPLLLLDEATSSLDTASEQAVQQALRRLQKGKTTLVIAHRLSTVVDADQIIVLDNGAVAEAGTHEELISTNGHYKQLWQGQHQK